MGTKLHRQKHIRQKQERQRKRRKTAETRWAASRELKIDPECQQSAISRRWIKEAPQRGRCAKLEAIYMIEDEAKCGKCVSDSDAYLAGLISDPERDVSIAAASAAGVVAAMGGSPAAFILPVIGLLRSSDDLVAETAIETLGEFARFKGKTSRSMILTKLLNIERNGADSDTKANAGFALSQIIQDAPDILSDKKNRRQFRLAFKKLTSSKDAFCKAAGTLGFCQMGIALAKAAKTNSDQEEAVQSLSMIQMNSSEDIYYITFLAYPKALPYLDHEHMVKLYSSAITLFFTAPDISSMEHAREFIRDGFFDPKMQQKIINGLAHWQVSAATALAQHALSKSALELYSSGVHPSGIPDMVECENDKQKEWLRGQIELGMKHGTLGDVLAIGTLTEDQVNLAMIKVLGLKNLREQGIKIARDMGRQFLTTFLQ